MKAKTGETKPCACCGTPTYFQRAKLNDGARFCSMSCRAKIVQNGFKVGHPYYVGETGRARIAAAVSKRVVTASTRLKISLKLRGKTFSNERRIAISEGRKRNAKRGPDHHNWKGGVGRHSRCAISQTLAYRFWREAVFKRDNFTCVECKKRGVKLNADHIKPFALFPDLRLELSNGRTLCLDCHKKTPTYGRKSAVSRQPMALAP